VTIDGNRSVNANFSQITYVITTSSSPPEGGTTSGGGSKACGDNVTVTATENPGYRFVSWTEGGAR